MAETGDKRRGVTRREALVGAAAGALALGARPAFAVPAVLRERRPNLLLILCDQMNLDAMSALGNRGVRTPNLDRLASRGVLFTESHSANPVCSPGRSAIMTGRMPVETGVVQNDLAIRPGMPNIGEWLHERAGYDTAYCGKWHLPAGVFMAGLSGFRPLPGGGGQGAADDAWIARTCGGFLRSRGRSSSRTPFFLVASFMQPHDICYWMLHPDTLVGAQLPVPRVAGSLPDLPPNHASRPTGPAAARRPYQGFRTEEQWRYYLYCYHRMVEMLDHDVGCLLDSLEDAGLARDTVVLFTSDHGEGGGRHGNVQKWHPYDESMKVPFMLSYPGHGREGARDTTHLVSGVDVASTLCDYAGAPAPPRARGRSVRPLAEGRSVEWREFVVAEWQKLGRVVRTPGHKYVMFEGDPAVQLFDMRADPWETTNLADRPGSADLVRDHARLLAEWNAGLEPWQAPAAG